VLNTKSIFFSNKVWIQFFLYVSFVFIINWMTYVSTVDVSLGQTSGSANETSPTDNLELLLGGRFSGAPNSLFSDFRYAKRMKSLRWNIWKYVRYILLEKGRRYEDFTWK
jgi:hypothetical protein